MRRSIKAMTVVLSVLVLAIAAFVVRQGSATKPQAKNNSDSGQVTANAPNSMTRDQAEAMLAELRQIRELLERQKPDPAHASASPIDWSPEPRRVQMTVGKGWNSMGRPDAPVTIVEFTDYECPFCKEFYATTFVELKRTYIDTGKIRWISRDFPLEFHPFAVKAAEAARCAGEQGRFWEMHDALLSNNAPPNGAVVRKSAEAIGLDPKDFQTCQDSDKFSSAVQKDAMEASELQISETPAFVVATGSDDRLNGIIILGAQPLSRFHSAIDALLDN
jgi:protein-disulfide isomerase